VQVHRPRHISLTERLSDWIDRERSRPAAPTLWWIACLALGIATLLFSLHLQSLFPASGAAMAPGYGAPVLAFEFARDLRDLTAIFGDAADPLQAERLAGMQSGNEQDYLFMLLYALFLATGCWALWRELRRPMLLLGVVMPVLAAMFDAWENTLLFSIQTAFILGEYAPEIELLAAPVTAKFLLLTATNIVIGMALSQVPGRGWQLVGVLVIVPCVATIMALIAPAAFGWTLAAVIAAGWSALLGTAAIASWRALFRKRPLANFTPGDLANLKRRRSDMGNDEAEEEGAPSPVRPAVFGRRRTDGTPDAE
jgi:hypothetical protein